MKVAFCPRVGRRRRPRNHPHRPPQRFQRLQKTVVDDDEEDVEDMPAPSSSQAKPAARGDAKTPARALSPAKSAVALAGAPAQRPTARVHFTLRFKTDWGQRLCLTGSQEGLGAW